MSSTQPNTIPVKYEFEGSLRRTVVDVPPRMAQLRAKLAQSFPSHADLFRDESRTLKLKYIDDEGDEITITSKEELAAAYRLAQQAGKVLRFTVPSFKDTETSPAASTTTAAAKPEKTEPVPVKQEVNDTTTSTATATATDTPRVKPQVFVGSDRMVHVGVTCDRSGQSPIVGPRFHKRGENFDLCEAEFDKIVDPVEKAKFIRLDFPVKIADWLPQQQQQQQQQSVVRHFGITCDRSEQSPIIGNRYHKRGQDYDLNEEEFNKITDAQERASYIRLDRPTLIRDWNNAPNTPTEAAAVHVGVTCDRSGQSPIIGNRYHKRGEDYDLNEAEFNKISDPQERANYIRLDRPTSLRDWGRPAGGPPFPFLGSQQPGQRYPAHHGFAYGQNFGFGHGFGFGRCPRRGRCGRFGNRGRGRTHIEFVADVTIPDGAVVASNTTFRKEWKLRTVAGPVPPGTTLAFVDGHALGGTGTSNAAAAVKVNGGNFIAPGTEFSVVNEFTAPTTPGNYRSVWRLQAPGGRRFGPRIWVEINVPSSSSSSSSSSSAASSSTTATATASTATATASATSTATTTTTTEVEPETEEETIEVDPEPKVESESKSESEVEVPADDDDDDDNDSDDNENDDDDDGDTASALLEALAASLQSAQLDQPHSPPPAAVNILSQMFRPSPNASAEEMAQRQQLMSMLMSGLGKQ